MTDERRKALERLRGFAYDAMAGERPDLIKEAVDELRQALTEPAVPGDPMAGPPELVEAYRAACRRLKELGEESVPLTLPAVPDAVRRLPEHWRGRRLVGGPIELDTCADELERALSQED